MSTRPEPPQSSRPAASVSGELVSSLMDGQLRGPLLAQTIRDTVRDPEAMARWSQYHLIGEALRSPQGRGASLAPSSPEFLARLQSRLLEEKPPQPGVPAPVPVLSASVSEAARRPQPVPKRPSLQWKAASFLASAAALAAVAWQLLFPAMDAPQWAQSAPQQIAPPGLVIVESTQGTLLRDAQLREFLAAHKQVAGDSALPLSGGFLRHANFEAVADAPR